jgi:hypothetical protein
MHANKGVFARMAHARTSQGCPLKLGETPNWPRSTPRPLPRGKRSALGASSIATAVATALHSSASLLGCSAHQQTLSLLMPAVHLGDPALMQAAAQL